MASAFSSHAHSTGNSTGQREQLNFSLEVLQGKTQHPKRTLPLGRLSIGSGSKCWLRLGGDGVPDIHSWLEVTRKEVELYVFEQTPRVQVNGEPVRFALLRGGESLMIGEYEFLIHSERGAATNRPHFGLPHLSVEQLANLEAELGQPREQLSAEQLVDRIGDEMQMVEKHQQQQRAGWANLMGALRQVQAETKVTETTPIPLEQHREPAPAELTDDLERLVAHVEALTRSLQTRSEQLLQRETGYGDAAASLLETQQKLAEQMNLLIGALEMPREGGQFRKASA